MVKKRPGHVPERTCIGCGKKGKKSEFLRIVKTTNDEVVIIESGKVQGRSVYVCRDKNCVNSALKKIPGALRKDLEKEELSRLAMSIEEQLNR